MSDDQEAPRLSSEDGCPCLYAELDPESAFGFCVCGHAMDEHDETGHCQVQGSTDEPR